jgi:hypothetical protein
MFEIQVSQMSDQTDVRPKARAICRSYFQVKPATAIQPASALLNRNGVNATMSINTVKA